MTPSPLRLAFALVWRRRADLSASAVCHLGERALLLSLPVLATRLVSDAGTAGSLPHAMTAWLALALAGLAGLRYLGTYFGIRAQEHGIRALRRALMQRALRVPIPVLERLRPGEIATLIGTYSEDLAGFASDTLRDVVPTIVTLLAAFVLLLRIDMELALAVVPTIALSIIGIRLMSRKTRPSAAAALAASARLDGSVEETIELMPALRHTHAEARHLATQDVALDALLRARLSEQRAMSWFGGASLLLGSLSLLLLVLIGTHKMTAGTLAPLEFVQALLFSLVMLGPLSTIANAYGTMRKSHALSDRIATVLAGPLEQPKQGDDLPPGEGAVSLDQLSFAYPGRPPLLQRVSSAIAAKRLTALVGPNGSGKTTTIRLLTRMLTPDDGSISIDGADIAKVSLDSLRRSVALVAQRDFLAYGSIRDNIDFGQEALTDDQVHAAAERAGLHRFIATLPDGYDTFVGSGGSALSGGQRKRLMLARALARQPRVLVLDEPTAMLDQEARKQVIDVLETLRGNTTVIVATHDRAVIDAADASIQLG